MRWNTALVLVVALGVVAPAGVALAQDDEAEATEEEGPLRGGRIEFDERLIRGERAAGAVYLFNRRPRALPGLVPMRRSFRSHIVEPVLADRPVLPAADDDEADAE